MKNITFSEYNARIQEFINFVIARRPWLATDYDAEQSMSLTIIDGETHGAVSLRNVRGERFMEINAMITHSPSLSSDTRVARGQILSAISVCDVLDSAISNLGNLRIWDAGGCRNP